MKQFKRVSKFLFVRVRQRLICQRWEYFLEFVSPGAHWGVYGDSIGECWKNAKNFSKGDNPIHYYSRVHPHVFGLPKWLKKHVQELDGRYVYRSDRHV